MTAAEKAAAATARAAEARRVTAASLTEGELAALLRTKRDAADAAKLAAEAAAAKAAAEAVAAPVAAAEAPVEAAAAAATAVTGATADTGTTETPATGVAKAFEDRLVAKVASTAIAALHASGLFPTTPAKPAAKPAAEGGVALLPAASPEEVAVLKFYKGAQAPEAPTPPPTRAFSWRPQTARQWRPPRNCAQPSSS